MNLFNKAMACLALVLTAGSVGAENWPCWRGPRLDGTSLETGIARSWSSTSNVVWKTELPGIGHASPIVWNDRVIVNGDHDGDSYIVALNRKNGSTAWKTPRENHTRSYCVPIIRDLAGRTQMILSGDKCVASYDPANGKLHWIIDGP